MNVRLTRWLRNFGYKPPVQSDFQLYLDALNFVVAIRGQHEFTNQSKQRWSVPPQSTSH